MVANDLYIKFQIGKKNFVNILPMITFLPEQEIDANGINQGFDACGLLNQTIHIPEA